MMLMQRFDAWLDVDNRPYWFRWGFCFLFAFVIFNVIFLGVTIFAFLFISFIVWSFLPVLSDAFLFWTLVRLVAALSFVVTLSFMFSKEGKAFVESPSEK